LPSQVGIWQAQVESPQSSEGLFLVPTSVLSTFLD
jgi:hypothetical protein